MSERPFLVLAALVLLQTIPALWSRDLIGGDEVRHGDALRRLTHEGHAVVLHMNGEAYPDKPPVWFWIVAGIQAATGWEAAPSFFLASALASLLLAWAAWRMAREVLGASPAAALASGLALLVTPLFLLLERTTRMDVLYAALLTLAAVQAFRGLSSPRGQPATVYAALLGGLATLVKGPLGLVALAAGVLLWLAWQGRLRRVLALDVLTGIVGAGMIVGAWLLAVSYAEGAGYLERMLREQLLGRVTGAAGIPGKQPWWFYLATFPATLWPWVLLGLAVPWRALGSVWKRRGDDPATSGRAFLVCLLLGGLLVLSLPRSKFVNYLLPLVVPASVLIGDRLLRLTGVAAAQVLVAIGGVTLVLGLAVPFGNLWHPWPVQITGLLPLAVTLVATGGFVMDAGFRSAPQRAAVFLAVGTAVASLVVAFFVWPSVEPALSPRAQAEVLAQAADRGDRILAYRVYPGTYSFHAARTIPETDRLEDVQAFLAAEGPVALAMPRKYFDRHRETFRTMRIAHEQWIVESPHVVLVREEGDGIRGGGMPGGPR